MPSFCICHLPHLPEVTDVIDVSWFYFRQQRQLHHQEALYLVESSTGTSSTPYEIIFRIHRWIIPDRYYSLWRFADLGQARDRFQLMDRLVKAVFYKSSAYRRDAKMFLQRLVRAMAERPAWREVHIAARNGYVEYFTDNTFPPALLNQQHPPDMMTPLHVAVLYGFSKTVHAILKQRPQIDLLDAEGNSVLHYAALTSHKDILLAILREPSSRALLVRNENSWNPVELVCFGENDAKHQQENLKIILKWGLTVRLLTMVNQPKEIVHPSLTAWLTELDDEHLVKFTDANLKHLNLIAARRGGCPLHWATHPSLIEHLVASGFHVDTPNIDGDRPLGLAIRRGDVKCALTLLCHGANTNLLNKFGDAPLHMAIRVGNAQLVKMLIIFGADVNQRDAMERSSRHMAATAIGAPRKYRPIQLLLRAMKAAPCEPGIAHCVRGCLEKEEEKEASVKRMSSPFNFNLKHRVMAEEILAGRMKAPSGKLEMMACFDGGGIRGLFTIQTMLELSKYLKHPLHHYFDWFSGTSTGALIAWALSTGRSLTTIRQLYFSLKDQVFLGRMPPFKAAYLERCLQTQFGNTTTLSDTLPGKRVLIFATLIKQSPPGLQIFRSYPRSDDTAETVQLNRWPVWMALRASTAAPIYFPRFRQFIDGGILANNPTTDSLVEYYRNQEAECSSPGSTPPRSNLKLVLSFGTGYGLPVQLKANDTRRQRFNYLETFRQFKTLRHRPRAVRFTLKLAKLMQSLATQSNDHIVWRSDSWCSSLGTLFYRINPQITKKLSLNEKRNEVLIQALWDVKRWILEQTDQLKQVADVLEVLQEAKEKMQAEGDGQN